MKILVVAGEASADIHAGHVIAKLQEQREVQLFGIGGTHLVHCGLQPIKTPREMAVVGLSEALKKIPQTLSLFRELEAIAAREKPDFALLLDLPDFNLRLAPRLKRLGIPVIYYISPQVWAWRSKRVKHMAKCLDLLLTILPFEKPWYEKNAPSSLPVEYVGHPVLEEVPAFPYEPKELQVALLPGSRESELERLLPSFLEAAVLMKRARPNLTFVLPLAESLRTSALARRALSLEGPSAAFLKELGDSLAVLEKPSHELLRASKLAIVASGTATLETAIVGVPMVVVYKVSPSTAFLFRHLVGYSGAIAMANLVHTGLGSVERVVPELLQESANPANIAKTALEFFENQVLWLQTKDRLAQTRSILSGTGSPTKNAADAMIRFLEKRLAK